MVKLIRQTDLPNSGRCHVLAVGEDGTLLVEEFYQDEWAAQHLIAPDGSLVQSVDERSGRERLIPLPYPAAARPIVASPPHRYSALHHHPHAPQRGLRAQDHIDGLAYMLDMADKIRLTDALALDLLPPSLIGLSRSVVLCEAPLPDGTAVICRALAFAYTLFPPGPKQDYDTVVRHVLQWVPPVDDLLATDRIWLPEGCRQPTTCAFDNGLLYVSDSGGPDDTNRILVYEL